MIPQTFRTRMERLLGEEAKDFFSALEEPAVRGVRINRVKYPVGGLLDCPFSYTPLPYCEGGYLLQERGESVGNTPEHRAGMIYVQDPGAMATVCAAPIEPGWRVADLCCAPGGKTSQLSEKVGEDGFVLANEYVPARAKIALGNFERLGLRNVCVTSLDTRQIAALYGGYFDLVLVDAPCSGEGMFRKYTEAVTEWSPENIEICAARQAGILDNAAGTVRPGGYLLYSTCTYAPEENEYTVDAFLRRHPEYALVRVADPVRRCTRDGLCLPGIQAENIEECRRFYPHISPGEGQFIALMQRKGGERVQKSTRFKDAFGPVAGILRREAEGLLKECIGDGGDLVLRQAGDRLLLTRHSEPLPGQSVFSGGVLLAQAGHGKLRPEHHFFSAYGHRFIRQAELTGGEAERLRSYLHGEELAADGAAEGYIALTYRGVALGGGKSVGGRIKNYYPKGLRE